MPDERQHRGPHPQDRELFDPVFLRTLRSATRDLSWLFSKDYASNSAIKLVGDRYSLLARQRLGVARCACANRNKRRRRKHQLCVAALSGQEMWIDGYNVLTSIEAALSGGAILHARDGCYRDMASMHGSYRKVRETVPAIYLLGEMIASWDVASCVWLLDAPVSNSGRLKSLLGQIRDERQWAWRIELTPDPDPVLSRSDQVVATADSQILDQANRWFNLARAVIDARIPDAWIVDLS